MTFHDAYDVLLGRWGVPIEQLDVSGTHVIACGPTSAPPVVLLAGHGATSAVWFAVAPQLAQHHRVYAPDLPGAPGRSTANPPRTIEDLVSWLAAVLQELHAEDPLLVGHSYGAWTALTYALHHPVPKLALIDPTDCFTGIKPTYLARALPMLLKPTESRYKSFIHWETQGVPVDPDWVNLAALGTLEPSTRPVRPRRPSTASGTPDLLVVVADRSKAHDPDRVAEKAKAAGASVVRMATATHHSLPAAHGAELGEILLKWSAQG
ncbi:alpha/beta fold hydrolase [Kribbella sp. NPDC055071]